MAITTAKTRYGLIEGVTTGECTVFMGVPFAKPPIGELRFKAPEEPESFEGVKKCCGFGPAPVQEARQRGAKAGESNAAAAVTAGSEDCLYLNIYTAAEDPDEKRPVMVWIYGGGFKDGNGADPLFDGTELCRAGAVAITVNYRLGALGFFSGRKTEGMNFGLLDQIAALKWIKENIGGFGGDPDSITVFGQSAGGMSCRMLITSPLTQGLINRAIIQSGGGLNEADPIRTKEEMTDMCMSCLEYLGWTEDDLLTKDAGEIITETDRAARALSPVFRVGFFQPFIDEKVMTDVPGKLIAEGKYGNVKVMCGTVAGDSWMFSVNVADRLNGNPEYFRGFSYAAQLSWAMKRAQDGKEPIYAYYMDRTQPERAESGRRRQPPFGAGTPHGSEIPYVFGTLGKKEPEFMTGYSEYDKTLSRAMIRYWVNFAKTGNPNDDGSHLAEEAQGGGSGLRTGKTFMPAEKMHGGELPFWPECRICGGTGPDSGSDKPDFPVMHFADGGFGAESIIKSENEMRAVRFTLLHPGLLTDVSGIENC